jgi:L-rhamnose isomerase
MNTDERYLGAKAIYKKIGIDTDAAIDAVLKLPISMHCWQGDDVRGFDNPTELSGGIQTTGNYPGRARTPQELMDDMTKVLSLVPGKHRINLHANYAIFENGNNVDRNKLEPKHFAKWVEFAKKHQLGIDFNPTLFSHPLAAGLTLSNPDKKVRDFWIEHCKRCLIISEYFAKELGTHCLMNIWIPDGMKDVPADRFTPRRLFKESLDEILSINYDKSKVFVCLESKVFGIGLESYTVGSSEFCMNYVTQKGIMPLMDNGHYHPTELVSDKISSMLLFHDKLALHVTRPVRWDSDHVVLFDDETREMAKEIVFNDALSRVYIALDFFDASINRVSAWVVGMRNMQKALLAALLMPRGCMQSMQEEGNFSELMMWQEEMKLYPLGDVYNKMCAMSNVPVGPDWYEDVRKYENEVLSKR